MIRSVRIAKRGRFEPCVFHRRTVSRVGCGLLRHNSYIGRRA
jgi:hypothetical protein